MANSNVLKKTCITHGLACADGIVVIDASWLENGTQYSSQPDFIRQIPFTPDKQLANMNTVYIDPVLQTLVNNSGLHRDIKGNLYKPGGILHTWPEGLPGGTQEAWLEIAGFNVDINKFPSYFFQNI
jgi:hypothetical protein